MTDFAFGETVTRHRASVVTDNYQNQVLDWDDTDDQDLTDCGVALSGTFDLGTPDRAAVEADFQVFVATGTDMVATDRLTIRGQLCDIVGQPFDWTNPLTGWQPGMSVLARVREG